MRGGAEGKARGVAPGPPLGPYGPKPISFGLGVGGAAGAPCNPTSGACTHRTWDTRRTGRSPHSQTKTVRGLGPYGPSGVQGQSPGLAFCLPLINHHPAPCGQRPAAMAGAVLLGAAHLRIGAGFAGRDEHRIVAETAFAARGEG